MRFEFIESIKKSLGMDEISRLVKNLKSEEPQTRRSIARRLGEINKPEVVEPLINALDDINMLVLQQVIESLGWLQSSKAVPKLLSILPKAVKEVQIDILGEISNSLWLIGTASIMPLIRLLDTDEPLLKEFVITTLVKFNDKRAIDPIIKCLGDNSKEVRLAAIDAVKSLIGAEGVPHLAPLLNDRDRDVKVTVEEFFNHLDSDEARAAVHNAAISKVNYNYVRRLTRLASNQLKLYMARHYPPEIEDKDGKFVPTKEDLEVAGGIQEMIEEAEDALSKGNADVGLSLLQTASDTSKKDGALCFKLSLLFEERNDKEQALSFAKEAVEREPDVNTFKKRLNELLNIKE
jgi:hypothetical protein